MKAIIREAGLRWRTGRRRAWGWLAAGAGLLAALLGAHAATVESAPRWSRGLSTDPGYFPIAVWLQDPRHAARYRDAGINLYVGLWKGPTEAQLADLAKVGIRVICDQNAVGLAHLDDPTIAGWMHGDEPDNAQSLPGGKGYGPPILPEIIQRDYARIRAADPTRPVLLNLGQGVAWDDYIGRGVRRRHPEDYAEYVKGGDIVSFDIYPAVHDSPEVAGRLEFVARGVERLTGWAGPDRLVWNCIECTRIGNPKVKPTPAQVRAEVWMALIRGSRGLIYFVHQFSPTFREAALLDDPEMLAAVTAINRRVRELAPVLNGPTIREALEVVAQEPSATVATLVKRGEGATYVFAANLSPTTTRVELNLPAAGALAKSAGATRAEVLDEKRTVEMASRRLVDAFGPYAVHLYRVPDVP